MWEDVVIDIASHLRIMAVITPSVRTLCPWSVGRWFRSVFSVSLLSAAWSLRFSFSLLCYLLPLCQCNRTPRGGIISNAWWKHTRINVKTWTVCRSPPQRRQGCKWHFVACFPVMELYFSGSCQAYFSVCGSWCITTLSGSGSPMRQAFCVLHVRCCLLSHNVVINHWMSLPWVGDTSQYLLWCRLH